MMSAATIQDMSYKAAEKAARTRQEPFIVWPEDIAMWRKRPHFPFPFLGDYVPRGWQRTEREPLFVDSSGFGRPGEPALTVKELVEQIRPDYGYAIIEQGQFQLYIAEYEKDETQKKGGRE